jgi:diguanylate cyclase (GGDEF)-like protein
LTERSKKMIPDFLDVRADLDDVLENGINRRVEASLAQRSDHAQQTVATSRSILVGSLVVGLALGLGAMWWVRTRITRPVKKLMRAIAGDAAGDPVNVPELNRGDEFGVLARALDDAARQREALEEELRRQALEDPLTGLANRRLFKDRVELALNRQTTHGQRVAVAFLDLDDFKTINDSLGHAAGDDLLVKVARRIKESVSTSDTTARLGGDEFAVLLEDADDPAVPAQRILEALAEPIEIEGKPIVVRGSVGIAVHRPGQTTADLLRNADVAMYGAKGEGKGQFRSFDQKMHSAAVQRFELKNELLSAVANQEFTLHYQPIFDLSTERVTAVEALVRWNYPERGW